MGRFRQKSPIFSGSFRKETWTLRHAVHLRHTVIYGDVYTVCVCVEGPRDMRIHCHVCYESTPLQCVCISRRIVHTCICMNVWMNECICMNESQKSLRAYPQEYEWMADCTHTPTVWHDASISVILYVCVCVCVCVCMCVCVGMCVCVCAYITNWRCVCISQDVYAYLKISISRSLIAFLPKSKP